jgi:hypothetical protein
MIHKVSLLIGLVVGLGFADAHADSWCADLSKCWTLKTQVMDAKGTDHVSMAVQSGANANPIPGQEQRLQTIFALPRFNPDAGGYYSFDLDISPDGSNAQTIHFQTPSYVRLSSEVIPVWTAKPLLQRSTVQRLVQDSISHVGGTATLWRVYFQTKLLLPDAQPNHGLYVPLQKALFNACSGLARTNDTWMIYRFDKADCVVDESVLPRSDIVQAELSYWLWYAYCKTLLDQYGSSIAHKPELRAIDNTLEYLNGKRREGEEQQLVREYRASNPNKFDLIPSDDEFNAVLEKVRCLVKGKCN